MVYGLDAIDELIRDSALSYPVTVRELEREHALTNIDIDSSGQSIMVGELLTRTDVDRFESEADLHERLGPLFERERSTRRTGIIGKLKDTFLGPK